MRRVTEHEARTSPPAAPPRSGPGAVELSIVAVILVLAAVLRLGDLDLMEFKGDEAVAMHLALPMVEGAELPRVGLVSSVGVHNPPLFIYLVALPTWIHADPLFVTGGLVGVSALLSIFLTWWLLRRRFGVVVAVSAAALYAGSTWPVLYARKLWAQDVLPLFSILLLHLLLVLRERPKSRWIAALPVLLCALWQIHFSAFALIIVSALLLLPHVRRLHWPALGAGVVAAVLMLVPYAQHQLRHDYSDLRGFANIAGGKRADGSPRAAEKTWTLDPVRWAAYTTAGTSVSYSLGDKTQGDYASWQSPSGRTFRTVGSLLGHVLLALGVLWLLGSLGYRGWRRWVRREPPDGGQDARARFGHRLVVASWFLGFIAIFLLIRLEQNWPHYFIILYPVPFLVMALPLGPACRRFGRVGLYAGSAVVALVVVAHLSGLFAFRGYVSERGGTTGDYGTSYVHKRELVDWVVSSGLSFASPPGFEYPLMERLSRSYGDIHEMAAASEPRGEPPAGHKRVRVYDGLRWERASKLRCKGRQDFGPLVACPTR